MMIKKTLSVLEFVKIPNVMRKRKVRREGKQKD